MAVKELRDFMENGNIKNSVNFPECNMGICVVAGRVAITHENIPKMISQVANTLGNAGINIADLTNKSRGGNAYTLVDVNTRLTEEAVEELRAIPNMIRVRVLNH